MDIQKINNMEKLISRINILWMVIVSISIGSLYNKMDSTTMEFYSFGPSNKLIVFGLAINTITKYIIVVFYISINSLIRTLNHNILIPWLINSVQDITIEKKVENKSIAYEITYVVTVYSWVDFFIYMNTLLAQVDLLLIEILCNVIISRFITTYYLNYKIIKNDVVIGFPNIQLIEPVEHGEEQV